MQVTPTENSYVHAEDKTSLANVEFELKNKETGEVVGKFTTDKDGLATSELLPIATYEEGKVIAPITYVLSETKPLEGYEDNTETYEVRESKKNEIILSTCNTTERVRIIVKAELER